MCFEQRKSFKERIANKKQSFFEILSMEIHPNLYFLLEILYLSAPYSIFLDTGVIKFFLNSYLDCYVMINDFLM